MYKLIKNPLTQQTHYVLKDGILNIPFDPDNTDYQAYLAWVAEGNTPQEAE
jgi:hypothetical protein